MAQAWLLNRVEAMGLLWPMLPTPHPQTFTVSGSLVHWFAWKAGGGSSLPSEDISSLISNSAPRFCPGFEGS